jgi:hypothetical protein
MADEGLTPTPPKKTDGRKTRKKSSRHAKPGTNPSASKRLKELWADPEWRARATEQNRRNSVNNKHKGARCGVPDGMRKAEATVLWDKAKESAKQTMAELKDAGALTTDEKANEALETAITLMRSPMKQETRIAAARLVLDFTRSKPASKSDITVNKAEEWLAAVAEQNDEGKTSEDA